MSESLKIVATYATPIEADMARNRLEAAGIRAFLGDDYTVGWLWHLGTALQGVKLLVAESDVSQAVEALRGAEDSRATQEPIEPWACPACGAEVDGELEVCWACGTTAEGVEDTNFQLADAQTIARPADQVEAKGPPGPWLALLIAFCVPTFVLNLLVGIDIFVSHAIYPSSAGLLLLLVACDLLLVISLFQWSYYQPPSSIAVEMPGERREAPDEKTLLPQEDGEAGAIDPGAIARRACLAALLGMAFCPPLLNFYSVWLILKHGLYRPSVYRGFGFFVYTAILLDAAVCFVVLLVFLAAGGLRAQ